MDARRKAGEGVKLLKEAIIDLLKENPDGLRNAEIAELLGIRSSFGGGAKDYLSWSLLGMLHNEGRVKKNGQKYRVNGSP